MCINKWLWYSNGSHIKGHPIIDLLKMMIDKWYGGPLPTPTSAPPPPLATSALLLVDSSSYVLQLTPVNDHGSETDTFAITHSQSKMSADIFFHPTSLPVVSSPALSMAPSS